MDKGKLVEQGNHEDLYNNGKTYFNIFSAMANSLNIDKIARSMEDDDDAIRL